MKASTLREKIEQLAKAGLQPYCAYLSFMDGDGWELQIQNMAWIESGMPREEIISFVDELAIGEGAMPFQVKVPESGEALPGVQVMGGERVPELRIKLPGGAGLMEQYETMVIHAVKGLTIYGSDKGPCHLRACFLDYLSDEWHSQHNGKTYMGWRF